MTNFAEKLRALLKAQGLTQKDLAEALGTNQQQVSRWLEGSPPKWAYLLKVARHLGVTVDYLVDPERETPPALSLESLTGDEENILWLIRNLGLTPAQVVKRLENPAAPARRASSGPRRGGPKPGPKPER